MSEAALSVAFFLSGAAGLIFQVVWFHRAGLVFGNSLWAVTVVLTSFMGGLALGNALAGRYSSRIRRPLLVYARLEGVVAIAGVVITFLLPRLTFVIGPFARIAADSPWFVNLIRFASAFAVLVAPATAMGATLPVVVGALSGTGRRFGAVLGRLYGLNTLGAVAGVIAAEVLLVDQVGVGGTGWIAALLNVTAAGIGFWVARRTSETELSPQRSQSTQNLSTSSAFPRSPVSVVSVNIPSLSRDVMIHKGARLLLACAFLSGATLLALEVVWFRFLTLYVLSTTLAASLMLAAVLAAIGVGGLCASRWLPRQPAVGQFVPTLALLAGSSLVAAYAGFQSLTSGTQVGDWRLVLWFACALTCPTSFLSGALFTLIADTLRTVIAPDTRAAAWLTMANTTGALCGPPLAAFFFLPVLGMERTFFVLAIVYGVIGLLAFRAQAAVMPEDLAALKGPRYGMHGRRWPSAGAAAVLIVALAVFPFGAMSGRYFVRAAQPYSGDGSEIVATREGGFETILLMQQRWMGQPIYNRLVTNGFSMSGTAVPGMRYMRYFAYWPMLLHNGPLRHALLVCYGVGVTAGAVLDIPSLESLDVAEISPDIVAMSDAIYAPDRHPLHDPRVRLHIEDGRYFLETNRTRFDLITGEPPPPRTPGAVNIYTREYFQLIHDHLTDGGMTTYWLPVGRPNPGTDVDTIVRAFCDVFEDCSLWNATPFDLMLVGSRHATGPVADVDVRAAWQMPVLQARLREVGFEQPEQIGATFVGDAAFVRALLGDTPPLTDDFPHRLVPSPNRPSLSDPRYGIDRAVAARYQRTIDPTRGREAFRSSTLVSGLWPAKLIEQSLPFFAWQRVINRVFWEGGKPLAQIEDLHAVLTETSLRTLPLWILGSDEARQRLAETSDDGAGGLEYARALRALTGRDYAGAAAAFLGAEQRGLRGPLVRPLRVYALCLGGHIDEARQLALGVEPHDPDERHFWEWMGKTFVVRPAPSP